MTETDGFGSTILRPYCASASGTTGRSSAS